MKDRIKTWCFVWILFTTYLCGIQLSEHITDGDLLFATKEKVKPESEKVEISSDTTNVIDIISKNPNFSKFAELIRDTNLAEPLKNENNITLFIPNNSAFTDKITKELESLKKENKTDKLKEIVLNHVFSERISTAKLDNKKIENLNGKSVLIQSKHTNQKNDSGNSNKSFSTMITSNDVQNVLMVTEKKSKDTNSPSTTEIYIGTAKIIDGDINGKNGIIHEISDLLK